MPPRTLGRPGAGKGALVSAMSLNQHAKLPTVYVVSIDIHTYSTGIPDVHSFCVRRGLSYDL